MKKILLVLGLVGVSFQASAAPLPYGIIGPSVFKSVNYPDRSIAINQNNEVMILDDAKIEQKTFVARPGLADRQCVTFYSKSKPNFVLRHQGFHLKLQKIARNRSFLEDATFCPTPGLSKNKKANSVSFRSFNFPDRYIRHSGFRLFLHPYGGGVYLDDATFNWVAK